MMDEKIKEKFLSLNTREDVAELLGISDQSLRYFLYAVGTDRLYEEFTIAKKTGGERKICAPNRKWKFVQRKLANILNCVYKVKPAAHGFAENKDIVTNAYNHIKRKYVLNLDLEDFFDQINFGRVRGMFLKPPYQIGEEAATVLAQIACYKGKLPQGAPSSPIITNMICAPLDTQLTKLAAKYRLRYSRYADDITFSSFKDNMPSGIVVVKEDGVKIGKELVKIIEKNGFHINSSKSRMFDYRKRQEVTGLVVNKIVNIRRSYIKEIRAILNHAEKEGLYKAAIKYIDEGKCKNKKISCLNEKEREENKEKIEEWFIKVLKGRLEYVRHVKGKNHLVFIKYAKKLNELCGEKIFDIESQIELLDLVEKAVFILETQEKDTYVQGSGFIVKDVGLLTNYHVTKDNSCYDVKTYKQEKKICVSNEMNLKAANEQIDYAIYKYGMKDENALELGNSSKLEIGTDVIVIGYPNYMSGNSPDIQTVSITSSRYYFEQKIYTISGKIVHGSSGGVVLDMNHKVVGVIRCGAEKISDDSDDETPHGFIPIDDIIEDLKKQQEKS